MKKILMSVGVVLTTALAVLFVKENNEADQSQLTNSNQVEISAQAPTSFGPDVGLKSGKKIASLMTAPDTYGGRGCWLWINGRYVEGTMCEPSFVNNCERPTICEQSRRDSTRRTY